MSPLRALILRPLLALGGALLLVVGTALGFWWVVTQHTEWLEPLLGEKGARKLCDRIVLLRLQIPAADTDADGIPDWFEVYDNTDPRNGRQHAQFFALAHGLENFHVYAGERTRIRTRMIIPYHLHVAWPIGFRAHVSANRPVLCPVGGKGPGVNGPLEIVTTWDGYLEFEILVPNGDPDLVVKFTKASDGDSLIYPSGGYETFVDCLGWRLPVVPSAMILWIPEGINDLWAVQTRTVSPGISEAIQVPLFGPPAGLPHLAWWHGPTDGRTGFRIAPRLERPRATRNSPTTKRMRFRVTWVNSCSGSSR